MTDLDPKNGPALEPAAEPEAVDPPKPPPEPMTPKRVLEWNAYYDLYVAMFVLLMAFLGSANKIQTTNSAIWSSLQAGQQTAATGRPAVVDETSIAGQGRRWVNIPWLFELMHYGIYSTARGFVMPTKAPPAPGAAPEAIAAAAREASAARLAAAPRAEQFAVGAMIAVDALVRALTAFLLLGLRRKGPGLWWTAICVTLALGLTVGPEQVSFTATDAQGVETNQVRATLGLQVGGIAGTNTLPTVAPETWGLMFLVAELLLLHHAINLGKTNRLFAIPPLFLLWANMDEGYSYGLILLAAAVVGMFRHKTFDPSRPEIKPGVAPLATVAGPMPSAKTGLVVLGLSFAATFLSPSHVFGVLASFETIGLALKAAWFGVIRAFGGNVVAPTANYSMFSDLFINRGLGEAFTQAYRNYYFALVGVGLLSFLVNRRNFSIGRFLTFVATAALWALVQPFSTGFAVVFVFVMALNGQEWYLETFGPEGRLGTGWRVWSTGGRVVTISVLFYAIFVGTTGWGARLGDPRFGFGFNPDDFPFEAADALKSLPIEGNILNTGMAQGDAIAWRTWPTHKAYLVVRPHLNPPSVLKEFADLRVWLKGDESDKWRPVLDANGISVVMIQVSGDPNAEAPRTFAKMLASPNWILFYFDGSVAMFGRSDAKGADLAYFQSNKLDGAELAYKRPKVVPAWQRPPTQTSDVIDSVFENRLLDRAQPHTEVAKYWLVGPTMAMTPTFPDPARCLLAVREARVALSIKPDDPLAYRLLIDSYEKLLTEESAMIAGIAITPANARVIFQQVNPQPQLLANRTRQIIAALNFALQTSPPAKTAEHRRERAQLHSMMYQLYLQVNAIDLAREHLVAIDARAGEFPEEFFADQAKKLKALNDRIEKVQAQLAQIIGQNKYPAVDKAVLSTNVGLPGQAIHELEEVYETSSTTPNLLANLIDLYCNFGQPEKAYDIAGRFPIGDAQLATVVGGAPVAGTAAFRQGKLNFLLGNYDYAVNLWAEYSVNAIRRERSTEAPRIAQAMLNGEPKSLGWRYLELTEKVGTQAQWEFELGMAALEGGLPPDVAAGHFETALKLAPTAPVRPVIAYYLLKMGKEVPPIPVAEPSPAPVEVPTTPPTVPPGELPRDVFAPGKP